MGTRSATHTGKMLPKQLYTFCRVASVAAFNNFWRILLWIAFTEHGVARNQNFSPCPDHFGHGIEGDAAIYFNPITEPPLRSQLRQLADLMHRTRE